MINLVVDLNNLFFRSLFMSSHRDSEFHNFDSDSDIEQLVRKVSTDITYLIRKINPSRVIFACDSDSWRKSINIEENEGYKANRTKSDKINWDNIFKAYKDFTDILSNNGFIVSRIENSEADDLIALWTDELVFNRNEHVIIASSDEDVRQLATYNKVNNKYAFATVYNPFVYNHKQPRKLYVPIHFEEWLNSMDDDNDIFNTNVDVDKEDFTKLKVKESVNIETINGNDISLRKLFCGDDGDNIPSFYTWLNDKDKEVRITESKYLKIKEELKLTKVEDLKSKLKELKAVLKDITKKEITFNVEERYNRQLKLVYLHKDIFPISIISDFNKIKDEELKKPKIQSSKFNMNSLLEGTKYVSTNYTRKNTTESPIFRDIDKMTKTLF